MSHKGRVYFKIFLSVMGKFCHATIDIPAAKWVFTPVNSVLGWEPSWVNLEIFTSVRQSMDGMQKLLQEAVVEPKKRT